MPEVGMVRVRRSASEWSALVERYRQSGLSGRSFCEREGLAVSSFGNWVSKVKKEKAVGFPKGKSKFVALSPLPPRPDSWRVELEFRSGLLLRIRD